MPCCFRFCSDSAAPGLCPWGSQGPSGRRRRSALKQRTRGARAKGAEEQSETHATRMRPGGHVREARCVSTWGAGRGSPLSRDVCTFPFFRGDCQPFRLKQWKGDLKGEREGGCGAPRLPCSRSRRAQTSSEAPPTPPRSLVRNDRGASAPRTRPLRSPVLVPPAGTPDLCPWAPTGPWAQSAKMSCFTHRCGRGVPAASTRHPPRL